MEVLGWPPQASTECPRTQAQAGPGYPTSRTLGRALGRPRGCGGQRGLGSCSWQDRPPPTQILSPPPTTLPVSTLCLLALEDPTQPGTAQGFLESEAEEGRVSLGGVWEAPLGSSIFPASDRDEVERQPLLGWLGVVFGPLCFSYTQEDSTEPVPVSCSCPPPLSGWDHPEEQAGASGTDRPGREGPRDGELGSVKESTRQGTQRPGTESCTAWGESLEDCLPVSGVSLIPSK